MSGPELASKVIRRWFNRRRPNPPRALRIVLKANDQTVIDISSPLALAMIDCEYGKPVTIDGPGVKLILTEVEP